MHGETVKCAYNQFKETYLRMTMKTREDTMYRDSAHTDTASTDIMCTRIRTTQILCNTNTVRPDTGTTDIMNAYTLYTVKRSLLRRTQHRFIVIAHLHVSYMFRPFLGPSPGMSTQTLSKGRYNEIY